MNKLSTRSLPALALRSLILRTAMAVRPVWARVMFVAAGMGALAGCGFIKPGTPGHEPPSAGNYNPVSGTFNSSGR